MEHAKKLVLVEPRVLEQMQAHSAYKDLQKMPDKKTQAGLSMELQQMIEEETGGGGGDDDLKAKLYRQKFSRFKRMRNQIPPVGKGAINPIRAAVAPIAQSKKRDRRRRKSWVQY